MHRRYDLSIANPLNRFPSSFIDLVVYSDSRSEHRWSEVFEQGAPEHARFSPESPNGSTTRMVLAFSDPDTMFARMIRPVRPRLASFKNNTDGTTGEFASHAVIIGKSEVIYDRVF